MKCLTDIIGVSTDSCPCFTANLDPETIAKMAVSKSGLYLDGLEGGVFLRSVIKLDKCKKFVDFQFGAISGAKDYFIRDINMEMLKKYKNDKKGYLGNIGQLSYSGSITASKRLQYLKLVGNSDGILNIDNVKIIVSENITTDVQLIGMPHGATSGTIIAEVLGVNLQAGYYTATGLKAEVALKKNGLYQDYYIVYDHKTANPRDNKISCGCSGGDGYLDFITAVGGETDTYANFNNSNIDGYSHGIIADVTIKCGVGNLVCEEYDREDVIALAMAHAIRYKAGELLIENIMNSGEVNAYTVLGNERMWGKRNHFEKKYQEMVAYIVQTVDISSSDCYICRGDTIEVTQILN